MSLELTKSDTTPTLEPQTTLAINEVFYSIQGEASHMGRPCIFVRTMGCQMRCSFCDTEYAFYQGRKLSHEVILQEIERYPAKLVQITGGEPLLQMKSVVGLMQTLLRRGYEVLLETGGGIDVTPVPNEVIKIIDVKCPDSGELEAMNWSFLQKNIPNTQLKFVLSSRSDFDWACAFLEKNTAAVAGYPLWMSPVSERLAPKDLARWILDLGLNVRMQVQLHKIIWGAHARGV